MVRKRTRSKKSRDIENIDKIDDVTFLVGQEETEIKGDVFLLRSRSPVFDVMFNDDWRSQRNVIKLPDIDTEMFRLFLKLLVTENLKVDHLGAVQYLVTKLLQLLYISNKYDVAPIQSICRISIQSRLCIENVIFIYESLQTLNEPELEEKALDFIIENIEALMVKDSFLCISSTILSLVLKSDKLSISELSLFKRVCGWAESQCTLKGLQKSGENIRKMLGDLLFLIRFPLIPITEFYEIVEPKGILTPEEIIGISRTIAMKGTASSVKNLPFSAKERARKGLFNDENDLYLMSRFEYKPCQETTLTHVDIFRTSLYLENDNQFEVKLCILSEGVEVLPMIFKSSSSKYCFFLFKLDRPVLLKKDKTYHIYYEVKINGCIISRNSIEKRFVCLNKGTVKVTIY